MRIFFIIILVTLFSMSGKSQMQLNFTTTEKDTIPYIYEVYYDSTITQFYTPRMLKIAIEEGLIKGDTIWNKAYDCLTPRAKNIIIKTISFLRCSNLK
jgi:hypothetical protein